MKRIVFSLIRDEFPDVSPAEARAATETDRRQLAGAIARQKKLLPEQVEFDIVPY